MKTLKKSITDTDFVNIAILSYMEIIWLISDKIVNTTKNKINWKSWNFSRLVC